MHELSLCGAIADIANRRAAGRPVDVVHLQIGRLRQVVPDTLAFCWSLVTADTTLDGSRLDIDHVPAVLECRACERASELADQFTMACAHCGGFDVRVVTGEEFLLTSLELVG